MKTAWICVILIFSSAVGCTSLFFQPSAYRYPFVEQEGLVFSEDKVASYDGTKLSSWYFAAVENQKRFPGIVTNKVDRPKALVIQFHGNAENHTSHYRFLSWLPFAGYDLLTFSYRGYGESEGRAVPLEVLRDVKHMLVYANTKAREKNLPLIVYGQSLGGSLALRALQEKMELDRLKAIVIEGSFYSYRDLAREKVASVWLFWPFQWMTSFLVSDRLSPGPQSGEPNRLADLPIVPKLLIYMEQDPIVPIDNGERLFAKMSEPKEFWRIPHRGHVNANFVEGGRYREKLLRFLAPLATASP